MAVLVGFLVNPALLTYLGSVEFGTWKVCQNLLSFVSVTDGQAAQALKWTIANKQTSEDFEAKKRNIGSALIVWLRFLPATVLIGALISWFSPQFINELDPKYVTPARIASAFLVVGLILLPLQSIPESVMVGTNLGYRCSWVHALQLALAGGLMVTLAHLGFGVAGVAGAHVVATIFASVGMLAIA
ncbi:MAG: hypothetical protein IH831_11275, partial [Planctomycetes bacterium]|nr:hypothetical protein [Planctomycetota bacterium]